MNRRHQGNYFVGYADQDRSNILDLGKPGGAVAIVLGVCIIVAALLGTAWWFWTQAKTHPQQPNKCPLAVNIGLLTILPTFAVLALTYYVTLDTTEIFYSYGAVFYSYGPDSFADLLRSVAALYILLYAVFRGNFKMAATRLLPTTALAMALAAGLGVLEMGRQARGKGYNDMVASAVMTDWQARDSDTSLVTVQFTTDKGKECEAALVMDCNMYWEDYKRTHVADQGNDDMYQYQQYQYQNGQQDLAGYWEFYQDNEGKVISTEITYSQNNGNDPIFLCRSGPTYEYEANGDNGNYNYAEYGNYNYAEYGNYYNYQGEVDDEMEEEKQQEQDEDGYFAVSNILINSHACTAAFFTEETYRNEYIAATPESSILLCGIAAVTVALVFGSWSLCDRNETNDHDQDASQADFIPAPNGDMAVRRSNVQSSPHPTATIV